MQLTVEQSGALKNPPDKVSRLTRKNAAGAINSVERTALDLTRGPIPKGESGLYRSIKQKQATVGNPEGSVHAEHPLLELVEEKTSPHEIRPRGSVSDMQAGTARKALRFKIKGKVFFAAKVSHPGTKGKHSWKRGAEFVESALPGAIQEAVEAAMMGREYSGGGRAYAGKGASVPLAFNPLSK